MDAQLLFRILLIVVATVALVAIVMHYNSCMNRPKAGESFGGYQGGAARGGDRRATETFTTDAGDMLAPLDAPDISASVAAKQDPSPTIASGATGAGMPGGAENAQHPMDGSAAHAGAPVTSNDLLPKLHPDAQAFAELYPCGQGDLNSVNYLDAGSLVGISTNSRKNSNMQLRSDPPLPKKNVSPWNMSTLTPDCYRKTFEIGSS